jgi:hypothetical protein
MQALEEDEAGDERRLRHSCFQLSDFSLQLVCDEFRHPILKSS